MTARGCVTLALEEKKMVEGQEAATEERAAASPSLAPAVLDPALEGTRTGGQAGGSFRTSTPPKLTPRVLVLNDVPGESVHPTRGKSQVTI